MNKQSLDRLASARAKVDWGKKHLDALYRDITEFMESKPYTTGIELDADTGWYSLTMQALKPFNPAWPLMLGDAIHNIRGGLDHIVWAFALGHGGGKEPSSPQEVEFPITSNAKWFSRTKVKRWISVSQLAFIEQRQPYHGGDHARHPLWVLRTLSNADKHRVLHTAYALIEQPGKVHISFEWSEALLGKLVEYEITAGPESFLVDGTEFGRVRFERTDPNAQVKMKGQAPTLVAFGDPGWKVGLNSIGIIGAVVDKAVDEAAALV